MKKIAICISFAFLAAANAHADEKGAADAEICANVGDIAQIIIKARDGGALALNVKDSAEKSFGDPKVRTIVRGLINAAYSPSFSDFSPKEFRDSAQIWHLSTLK